MVARVRETLELSAEDQITEGLLLSIEVLDLRGTGTASITGIEKMPNLTSVDWIAPMILTFRLCQQVLKSRILISNQWRGFQWL
ncbi:hypothetical protein [Aquiflexum sp.]|uniref:hypothetical protein n=1 Tax=Aquiflexum sp. TaxID=1872584 RepID=UPI003593CE79